MRQRIFFGLFCLLCIVLSLSLFLMPPQALKAQGAARIDDESFFDSLPHETIDFDQLNGGTKTVIQCRDGDGTPITNQFEELGITFSSEETPGASQETDPGDITDRFSAPMWVVIRQSGGGAPTSQPNYAAGAVCHDLDVSDMRFDFSTPVSAVAMYFIDNDFSTVRFSAFDASGSLLGQIIIGQVGEGGMTYAGIDAGSFTISYAIIDAENGGPLDSVLVDDLTFTTAVLISTSTSTGTPTHTPTSTSTPTPTNTSTSTPTDTPATTPTVTPTPSNTPTPSITPTATSTSTPSPTPILAYLPCVRQEPSPTPVPSPPAQAILAPIDNSDQDNCYTVSWQSLPDATAYLLQEATENSFANPVTVHYTSANDGTSWTMPSPGKQPGTYYYRVRAENPGGAGPWSDTQSVTIRPLFVGLQLRWDGEGYIRGSEIYDTGTHETRSLNGLTDADTIRVHSVFWYDPNPHNWASDTWDVFYSTSTGYPKASSSPGDPSWKWTPYWVMPYEWILQDGEALTYDGYPFAVSGPHSGYTAYGQAVQYWELVNRSEFLFWDGGGDWKQYVNPGDIVLRYDAGNTRLLLHSNIRRTKHYKNTITSDTVQYIDNLTSIAVSASTRLESISDAPAGPANPREDTPGHRR